MRIVRAPFIVAALISALAFAAGPAQATSLPSGERFVGNFSQGRGAAIEPAYDDANGALTYILTPTGAPFPSNANRHAIDPLYIVVYPSSYPGWTLNCMGVPGNCPDHDGLIAGAATALESGVYGTDPSAVPGHDHLIGLPNTGGEWNVAWHVFVILFTNSAAANTHVTTLSQLQDDLDGGDAISVDSGIIFNCSAVSASAYWRGTPL